MELQENNTLSFLETNISVIDNKIGNIHRKPTFPGLGLSFLSFTSEVFKLNSIKTLLYRAYHVSSSYERPEELNSMKDSSKLIAILYIL